MAMRVRVKKVDGAVECLAKGLKWKPDGGKPILLIQWTQVKSQQVSSANSAKALIRLLGVTGTSHVLEFLAPSLPQAFDARNAFKNLIASKLARKKAIHGPSCSPSELKQRAALLASHPALKKQHVDMVDSGLISEEDFWASRVHELAKEACKRQRRAKTSHLLTALQSAHNPGEKVVRYNLNAQVIHQIFVQYPAVYRAYKAQVPDRMTETEFWSIFFKSNYFHRDRGKDGHEDLFTKYEEEERKQKEVLPSLEHVDPAVDLTSTLQDNQIGDVVHHTKTPVNPILHRFNTHASYVLDASMPGNFSALDQHLRPLTSKRTATQRLAQTLNLPDLQTPPSPVYLPLSLDNERRYFERSVADDTMHIDIADTNLLEPLLALNPVEGFSTNAPVVLDAMRTWGQQTPGTLHANREIPQSFRNTMHQLHDTVQELLRHFWSLSGRCRSGPDRAKVDRIVVQIEQTYDGLRTLRQGLPPNERSTLAPLLKPFEDALNHAYVQWKENK